MMDNRKNEFMADLQELLNKHRAELLVSDDRRDYGMHKGTCTITFEFDVALPYCEFELPTYMRPESGE